MRAGSVSEQEYSLQLGVTDRYIGTSCQYSWSFRPDVPNDTCEEKEEIENGTDGGRCDGDRAQSKSPVTSNRINEFTGFMRE